MNQSKRARMGIIFFTILINMIGFGVVIPVLPFYAERFGATPWEIGWLFGIFSLVQFIFAPLLGHLSDKFGRRPVLILSTIGTATGFFIMGFAQTLVLLFVGRVIDGMSGGSIGAAQAYVADITGPEDRSKAMGLIGAAFGLGFIFGPALGGWTAAHLGHSAPLFVAGGLAVLNTLLILLLLPESLPAEKRSQGRREPLFPRLLEHVQRRPYFTVVATYFLLIAGFSVMTAVFALYVAKRHGFDEKQTGYLFAMLGVIGVVVQGGLIGRLVKMFGEARIATAGSVFLVAGLFGTPLSTSIGGLLLACAGIALGNSLMSPTLSGIASRSVDEKWQGRALGVMQSGGSLARFIGPVLGGWLLTFDLEKPIADYALTPFWVAAAIVLTTFFLCLRLPKLAAKSK